MKPKLLKIIQIVLIFIFVFFKTGISQYKNELDSILSNSNPDELEDGIRKIDLYYKCAILSKDYVVMNGTGLNKLSLLSEGLMISLKTKNEDRIQKFYHLLPEITGQMDSEIFIHIRPYDDFISDHKLKDLNRFRLKIHGGSIDAYKNLIKDSIQNKSFGHLHRIYLWRGLMYLDWNNSYSADGHFKIAQDYAIKYGDSIYLSKILIFRGYAKWQQNKPDSAIHFFNKSLAISDKMYDSIKISCANNNLGQIFFQYKLYTEALRLFKLANQHCTDNFPEKTNILINIAKTDIYLSNFREAKKTLEIIESKVKNLNRNLMITDYLFYKALLYEKSGLEEKAVEQYRIFNRFKDSVLVNEIEKFHHQQITEISNELGANISKKTIEFVKNQKANITLNRSNIIIWILTVGSIFILIFILLLYRSLKASQKSKLYLKELNETKNTFLGIISHDLRSPLAAFINLLTPLQQDIQTIPTEKLKHHLLEMENLSKKCYLLLNNLLQWSKNIKNIRNLKFEKVNLKEIIDLNIGIYQTIASKKNIRLKSEINENIEVLADMHMIDLVVRNIIDNAIKNTNEYGNLIIWGKSIPGFHQICFKDSGKGLNQTEIDYLQKKQETGSSPNSNSGLGLQMCKEFVEAHGGKLSIISEGEGKGSCFSFTLKKI